MKPQDITPPAAGEAAHTPKLSRQRIWQLERIANGLCPQCGEKKAGGAGNGGKLCKECASKSRITTAVSVLRKYGLIPRDFGPDEILIACNSHDKLVEAESVLCALVSLLGHKIGGQELSDRAISDPVKFARLFAMALSARDTETFAQARAALEAAKS